MDLDFKNPLFLSAVIVYALIIALHILGTHLDRMGDIMSVAALALHIALLPLLFFAGAGLDVMLLFVLGSMAVYIASAYIAYQRSGGGDGT